MGSSVLNSIARTNEVLCKVYYFFSLGLYSLGCLPLPPLHFLYFQPLVLQLQASLRKYTYIHFFPLKIEDFQDKNLSLFESNFFS